MNTLLRAVPAYAVTWILASVVMALLVYVFVVVPFDEAVAKMPRYVPSPVPCCGCYDPYYTSHLTSPTGSY